MPIIKGAASDATTYRRVSATITPDPTIKSASYTYPLRTLIPSTRAYNVRISPSNTILGTSVIVGYQFATGRFLPRSPDVL